MELVRRTLRKLLSATDECVQMEASATKTRDERLATIESNWSRLKADLQQNRAARLAALKSEQAERLAGSASRFDAEEQAITTAFATASSEINQLSERDEAAAEKEFQEATWTIEAIYDAEKKKAREKFAQQHRTYHDHRQSAQSIRAEVATLLEEWEQIPVAAPGVSGVDLAGREPAEIAVDRLEQARGQLKRLRALIAPKLLIGDRMLYVGLVACAVIAAVGGLVAWQILKLEFPVIFGVAFGLAAVLGGGGSFLAKVLLAQRATRAVRETCTPLHRALAEVDVVCKLGEERDEKACKELVASEKQKYQKERAKSEKKKRELLAAALTRRDQAMKEALARRDRDHGDVAARRTDELRRLEADLQQKCEAIGGAADREIATAEAEYSSQKGRVLSEFDGAWTFLERDWSKAHAEITDGLTTIDRENAEYFPDWSAPTWKQWSPPRAVPPTMRFGELVATLPAVPRDSRLPAPPREVRLPALLPFPVSCATLLTAGGAGRAPAAQALLALATRFLTALPAGKARLTIIDPVGLGENFAALMHLADHDPLLVGARIWTEPAQIEKRLTDLTAHMENVIQKYLRSQYASIEEYNAQAGEVAEPYRVLVVANFPANFTAEAARRLERIAASGASCGVYTIVSRDPSLPAPQDYSPADLERASLNLIWKDERFVWKDSDFEPWPLAIDAPPPADVLMQTLDKIGKAAKVAGRVEVDFSFIAPPAEKYWTGDSRAGIDVPLGRAGATKRQHLQLGKGTAQHALVAGKTGSGKSTLLHALITNLALTYGPDEVELYLIDFKKGVEFKTYANHRLPHARVIAVESEREFGLSVLQRLDQELKQRGELFRSAGVQDIRGYRDAEAGRVMPRIMLIVDEFQEFFVEDDRVAQEAALLLDRLVRQGRAFGLHVLLGSQTLGGAYSLARSTIDQMAVRIALQCSEADAGLILSKDNSGARLLTRPGEAIYNDANGLVEGNDIFQVCWLADDRREQYLQAAAELAARQQHTIQTVVFEGNVPSDLTAHPKLRELIDGPRAATVSRDLTCWLGDAMAIKAPTAAVFRRQSASNLMILGQQPEPARSILAASVVAALAQSPGVSADESCPRVVIFDGTPADDPLAGWFSDRFGSWAGVRVAGPRDVAEVMRELGHELERRQTETGLAVPVVVMVYGLHRFKDLRKADDDFGFNRGGGEPGPAQRFTTLLRDGPTAGLHTILWCDTLVNLQRAVERQTLREFEMKVLFQMGANDSSTLIDSPAAARLGVNRGLFAHEELSAPEKFRPYSLPEAAWLAEVGRRLAGK